MVDAPALGAALISTGFISLAPNLLLFAFPKYARGEGSASHLMSLGQAMAAGGLLGDVFLHTLSHACDKNFEAEMVGVWVIVGFTIFLVADMLIRSVDNDGHHHSHSSHSHSGHAHSQQHTSSSSSDQKGKETDKPQKENDNTNEKEEFHISARIVLNLAGDALHNFTDGLAIGSSYALQSSLIQHDASLINLISGRGALSTLSIVLHEIPHEIGDYSTLM